MEKLLWKNNDLYLRFAEYEDLDDLFKWRNDEDTRKASFNTNKIDIKEHASWFKDTLINPQKNIFIICDKNCKKLGQIRFDRNDETAEINITINPKFRNKGIGTLVLIKSSKYYLNNFNVKTLVGKVKINNLSSIKAFEKAGFKTYKKFDEFIELRYEK